MQTSHEQMAIYVEDQLKFILLDWSQPVTYPDGRPRYFHKIFYFFNGQSGS